MDTYQQIALAVAVFGIGASVVTGGFDMDPVTKSIFGWGGIALMIGGVGMFVLTCLPVVVRRKLHLMSGEEQRRWRKAEQVIAVLTPEKKVALWMYLENEYEQEKQIERELQYQGMQMPNYELFEALRRETGFMRLEFGGIEGVKPEWRGIVRKLLAKDPTAKKVRRA